MARTVIPTNFQDDELAEEMQGRRRYRQILNTDGTVSFEDETDYDTEGSTFGASRVNEMAQNINESADVNKIIDDLEDISVVTQNGFMAGAKAVKELNNNLGNCTFSVDENGAYVTYTPTGGADSVTKKLGSVELTNLLPLWNNAYCVYSKDIGDWGSVGDRKSTRLSDEEGLFVCATSSSSTSQGFISASPNCTFDGWSMVRTQFTYNGHIYYVYWMEYMRSGYMIYAHSNSTGERSGMNAVINTNGVITDTAFDFFMKIFDYYLYET